MTRTIVPNGSHRENPTARGGPVCEEPHTGWANLRRPRVDPSRYDERRDRFGVTPEDLALLAEADGKAGAGAAAELRREGAGRG